jgi:uncharacterized RDD family membrane protein YckC
MSRPEQDVPEAQAAARAQRASRPAAARPSRVLGPEDLEAIRYAGLATRTIAFALDAAVINGAAAITGVAIGLGVSILHLSEQAETVIAGALAVAYVVWSIVYFLFFWSTSGQTPGNRVMRIRVLDGRHMRPVRPVRAVIRFAGLILAALPFLAGFVIMLWDDRRRCLQDRIAHTIVIEDEPPPPPELPSMNGHRGKRAV